MFSARVAFQRLAVNGVSSIRGAAARPALAHLATRSWTPAATSDVTVSPWGPASSKPFSTWKVTEQQTIEDVRAQIKELVDSAPDQYGDLDGDGMDLAGWNRLVEVIAPCMSSQERDSLFTSMDLSCDGYIQPPEIYSDIVMGVFRTRFEQRDEMHPVKGSYASLPCPPFVKDDRQLEAVTQLAAIYDKVLSDWKAGVERKVERVQPKAVPKQQGSSGIFGFITGSSDKNKSPEKAPSAQYVSPNFTAPTGLYLYGTSGSGKTVLLNVLFRSLPCDFPVIRLHWHEFLRDALRYMHDLPQQSRSKVRRNVFDMIALKIAGHCKLFLLDEINITHISEAILVKELFRSMWMHGVTIITTSNYKPQDLYAEGFNRDQFVELIPELQERCPLFDMMASKDYRKVGVVGSNNFIVGLTPESKAGFDTTFTSLCEGGEAQTDFQLPIPWEGRSIHVPLCNEDSGLAKFDFMDLCGKTLGRADYALIATHYHTIFVDNMPKLTHNEGAEFKRFVAFVDMIYDKKVALHIRSEVPCEDIYYVTDDTHVDERLAWTRCKSMLTEMKSTKYSNMAWLMRAHLVQANATAF